jgi:hypothetical protein
MNVLLVFGLIIGGIFVLIFLANFVGDQLARDRHDERMRKDPQYAKIVNDRLDWEARRFRY